MFIGENNEKNKSKKTEGRASHTRAGNKTGSELESRGRVVDQATEGAGWRERNREGRGLMFGSFYGDALAFVIEDQNRRKTITAILYDATTQVTTHKAALQIIIRQGKIDIELQNRRR